MSRTQYSYVSISRGISLLMDGGKPYSYDGVLWRPPGISGYGARLEEVYGFGLGNASIQNRSGVALSGCGLGGRLHRSYWRAGQWTNGITTFTDDTPDAQSSGATDFPMETLVANDGFLVAALHHFNAIVLDIGTASTGTNPVRTLEYSLAGGTWSALSNMLVPPVTGGHYAVGENMIMFGIPPDWAVLEAGHGTGVPIGSYGIRLRSTTPPGTTAAVANSLSVAKIFYAIEGLADNSVYEIKPSGGEIHMGAAFDAAVVAVSSKAAIQSMVHADLRVV